MHVEKNIRDNIIGTILNIDGKTKDTNKARLDLQDMNIRKELHLVKHGNRYKKPECKLYINIAREEGVFSMFKSIEFPDGFAPNISKNISVKDGKLSRLKSHDCNVFLQRIFPIGIRKFLPHDIVLH